MMKLAGKIALVTGGSRGIGKAISEEVLVHGGKVSIVDVLVDEGLETKEIFEKRFGEGTVLFIKCDVTDKSEFSEAFEKTKTEFGRIDIVVNNAGIYGNGQFLDDSNWRKIVDVNLTAVIEGSALAQAYMSKKTGGDGGVLVNMGSIAGLAPFGPSVVYAAAKHGVVGASRSLAVLLEDEGIRVGCICPTFIMTDLVCDALKLTPDLQTYIDDTGSTELSEVVKVFRHIVEEEDVTGSVIQVIAHGPEYVYPESLKGKFPN